MKAKTKRAKIFLAKLAKCAKGTLSKKLFWFKSKKRSVALDFLGVLDVVCDHCELA